MTLKESDFTFCLLDSFHTNQIYYKKRLQYIVSWGGFYSSSQSGPKKQPHRKKFEQNFPKRRFTNNTVGCRSVSVNGGALRGIPIHFRKHSCQRRKSNMTPVNLCMQNFGQWKPQTNHQTTETWMQKTDFHGTCGFLSATFSPYRDSLPKDLQG